MNTFKASITLVFSLTLSLSAMARGTLKDNFCVPEVDSKRYLSGDFSTNYPKTVKFECTYECQANGKIDRIKGTSSVTVNSVLDDASQVVCQGVKVKKVPWGYDFDRVEAFYGYDTGIKEIKAYSFNNIDRNNKTEREHLLALKAALSTVITAYGSTGAPNFIEAADILMKIANELPASTKTLDRYIGILVKLNGKVQFDGTARSLVLSNLNGNAFWRVPNHLFK